MKEPIDLGRRQIAREIESELGGLFGIGLEDIERAIGRLQGGVDSGDPSPRAALPPELERATLWLEAVLSLARQARERGDSARLLLIDELVNHYSGRIRRLRFKRS